MDNSLEKGLITWKSDYNTGIKRIDFEHRIFLELINSYKALLDQNRPNTELIRVLNEIEKYAVFHFVSEENCMITINYPDYRNHQIQHFELLDQFNIAKFEKIGYSKFYDFIKDWFIHHTIHEDMKIKEFIVQSNIQFDDKRYNLNI